ncbi:type II toxin-antitoxin system VapC family toxin [Bosea beijingensis]|uniref:type II toxin-antitoxin system VapC family toxin n=1 Tax=Bosea beijingensis TaxID=3068632 RepID=UPI00274283A9|nr:type II toxin-antitoxin system VapC family toxin [Bosea sp. REN20]
MVKIVIDSSALVAILTGEADAGELLGRIAAASERCLSAANHLETRIVLGYGRNVPSSHLEELIARWQVDIVPFDEPLSDLAFEAYGRYGKGRHPARLNMGDCAAYALAKSRGWPLLYKGDDFSETDIERA